jgi:putative tricarboxylic transport membrane protein
VRADHPANNLQELVEAAKREPRSLKMGGANVGSTDWMGVQIFADAAGIEINYIAYEGGAATTAAFLGGNVDAVLLNPDDGLPLAKDGKAKLFAVLSEERRTEPDLKDIPTAKEQGVDAVMVQAFGVSGPPELDPAIATWWAEKLDQAHETEGWKKMLADNYYGDGYVSGPEAKKFMDDFFNMYKAAFIKFGVIKDPS